MTSTSPPEEVYRLAKRFAGILRPLETIQDKLQYRCLRYSVIASFLKIWS